MRASIQAVLTLTCLTLVVIYIWTRTIPGITLTVNETPEVLYAKDVGFVKSVSVNYSEIICSTIHMKDKRENFSVTKTKIILFLGFPNFYEIHKVVGFQIFESCPNKCELTIDNNRFSEADVVIFYAHYYSSQNVPVKSPGQIWAFFAVESPPFAQIAMFAKAEWRGLFNWTMSYRYDSELWHGYLRTVRRTEPISMEKRVTDEKEWREVFSKKTKMVAWFVSHCNTDSKREKYAKELAKYIQVDIYGTCGTLTCERNNEKCLSMVRSDYKFYLSFENSLCRDYVTEKLKNVYDIGAVVPVVRGGADYQKLFPDNSLVDASHFPSAKSLAKYLNELAVDEDAYIKFLQWTWDFEILGPNLPICQVCERLHQPHHVTCYYNNVYNWWSNNTCVKPRDI